MEILEVPDFVVAYDREDHVELQLAPQYAAVIEAAKALLHESEYWNQADLVGDLLETVEALEEVERA